MSRASSFDAGPSFPSSSLSYFPSGSAPQLAAKEASDKVASKAHHANLDAQTSKLHAAIKEMELMAGEMAEMEVLMVALRELLVERDADIDKIKVGTHLSVLALRRARLAGLDAIPFPMIKLGLPLFGLLPPEWRVQEPCRLQGRHGAVHDGGAREGDAARQRCAREDPAARAGHRPHRARGP